MDGERKIGEKDVVGLKYFDMLRPLLARLHDDGTARDRAGNRRLFYDDYCALVLLQFFNPCINSLRAIRQASELKNVQRKLGCSRASLGSLSESARVFDPERLPEIVAELGERLRPIGADARLAPHVQHTLTLVDGSLLAALPDMATAALLKEERGSGLVKYRLHTQFEVLRGVPNRIDVTPDGGGPHDERAVLARTLEADRTYVMDRGYAKYELWNAIVAAGSGYVCRARDNIAFDLVEERELTDADREANVTADREVRLGTRGKPAPDHRTRLVEVATTPHRNRSKYKGGSTGPGSDGTLRIVTNLLDVPAAVIALIYRYRWTIETFFRFFKHLLGCRHLLSHDPRGIAIQVYCAIIACMLISLWTGRKPTKRTMEMLCHYFTGLADESELEAHLATLKAHDQPRG